MYFIQMHAKREDSCLRQQDKTKITDELITLVGSLIGPEMMSFLYTLIYNSHYFITINESESR